MQHTGGWGAGVIAMFSANADGKFVGTTKNESRSGLIPKPKLDTLIAHVVSAGPGPGADDAGEVEFKLTDKDGRQGSQYYSYPVKEPCQRLLGEIDILTAKYKQASPNDAEPRRP